LPHDRNAQRVATASTTLRGSIFGANIRAEKGALLTSLGAAVAEFYVYARRHDHPRVWKFRHAGTRGVEYIVTEDMGLVTNYQTRFTEIKDRFDQMVVNLPAPYPQATLPQVITPQTILTEW
jgi:hypothetical protein